MFRFEKGINKSTVQLLVASSTGFISSLFNIIHALASGFSYIPIFS